MLGLGFCPTILHRMSEFGLSLPQRTVKMGVNGKGPKAMIGDKYNKWHAHSQFYERKMTTIKM
jgi:hypothetical protein